ncbi:uncharacterized protein UV8b_06416 [Ustilaginoidea virens]|uniref:Uncharacterized protein n=1 Tax=Ustilaginoidea virens TaxID=1159556 RepID=A0A8E5HV29_USTVR|nr:uncharacterized protein UV8b_06416 [Ustilaginoidea virens]QUC22175.1 hypothetical protein UV8b_06416 [Ustilaginoidea virens]
MQINVESNIKQTGEGAAFACRRHVKFGLIHVPATKPIRWGPPVLTNKGRVLWPRLPLTSARHRLAFRSPGAGSLEGRVLLPQAPFISGGWLSKAIQSMAPSHTSCTYAEMIPRPPPRIGFILVDKFRMVHNNPTNARLNDLHLCSMGPVAYTSQALVYNIAPIVVAAVAKQSTNKRRLLVDAMLPKPC